MTEREPDSPSSVPQRVTTRWVPGDDVPGVWRMHEKQVGIDGFRWEQWKGGDQSPPPHEDGLVCILEEVPPGEMPDGGWHDTHAVDSVYAHVRGTLRRIGTGTLRIEGGRAVLGWRGSTGWRVAVACTWRDVEVPVLVSTDPLATQEPLVVVPLAETLYQWATDPEHPDHAARRSGVQARSMIVLERRERARALEAHGRAYQVPSEVQQIQQYQVPDSLPRGRHSPVKRADGVQHAIVTRPTAVRRLLEAGARVTGGERKRDGIELSAKRSPCSVKLSMRHSQGKVGEMEVPDPESLLKLYPREWVQRLTQEQLPGLEPRGDQRELWAVAVQAVADIVGARRCTWLYATVGEMLKRTQLRLTAEGKLPDDFRCAVMLATGCDPHRANSRQKREYEAFMHLVMQVPLMVTPLRKGTGKRKPKRKGAQQEEAPHLVSLLVTTAITVKDGTAYSVDVNPLLSGNLVRLPRELVSMTDADDPDGVVRALGVSLLTRVQLSMARQQVLERPESLHKVLERAGLLSWALECERDTHRRGRSYVKSRVEEALEQLRRLPSLRGAMLDAIGGTHVAWGHGKSYLTRGKVHWQLPRWLEKRDVPALPPAPK